MAQVCKLFDCPHCQSYGKICLKGPEADIESITLCPCCGADITIEGWDEAESDQDE